jgi:endonuclease III
MRKPGQRFGKIVQQLERRYGQPEPPIAREPLAIIVLDNIAYLADDRKREAAFNTLKSKIGLLATDILSAPQSTLVEITKLGGIHAASRAQRIKESARLVLNEFDGDLSTCLKLPLAKAIKSLKRFPSIGDPGAEKILLFSGTHPILALESNGLRVLLRLGFGEEKKSYSASYRSVRQALSDEAGSDCEFLVKAHQLLRQHGKEICKSNNPACEMCPVAKYCNYYDSRAS